MTARSPTASTSCAGRGRPGPRADAERRATSRRCSRRRSRCTRARTRCSCSTTRSPRSSRTAPRCGGSPRSTSAATTDGRDDLIQHARAAASADPEGVRDERRGAQAGGLVHPQWGVRFRGLDVGSRVVLQYVYHDPPPAFLPNHFVSTWLFQGVQRQLVERRWVVELPAGRELAMDMQGADRITRCGTRATMISTSSRRRGAPARARAAMPPARDLLATVTLSTLTDWRGYVDWERALLSEVFESNAQLRALADAADRGREHAAGALRTGSSATSRRRSATSRTTRTPSPGCARTPARSCSSAATATARTRRC